MLRSWHIPFVPTWQSPPRGVALYVLFLERLPEYTRTNILAGLEDVDKEWIKQFDPSLKHCSLIAVPWIRDYWPSSEHILYFARQYFGIKKASTTGETYHTSFIIIDSGWEAATAIVVRVQEDGTLDAARVPFNVANALLSLCERGIISCLAEGLGEEEHDKSKVDFHRDAAVPEYENLEEHSYEPPSFLPASLAFSKEKPIIVSLTPLETSTIEALKAKIGSQTNAETRRPITIYNWHGPPATGQEAHKLFFWMERNTPEPARKAYAYFVDNIYQGDDGLPQLIAASRQAGGDDRDEEYIRWLSIDAETFLPFWQSSLAGDHGLDRNVQYNKIWRREMGIDLTHSVALNIRCCHLFYLCRFNQEEERKIGKLLRGEFDEDEAAHRGTHFAYYGYLWPRETQRRTLEELRDLFEKSDPYSPSFDPQYSSLRMLTYPPHFVAVDERIFDVANPVVILASSIGFSGETNDDLGWMWGLVPPNQAYFYWLNLNVGSEGLPDMFGGSDKLNKLWLTDLKAYMKQDWNGIGEVEPSD